MPEHFHSCNSSKSRQPPPPSRRAPRSPKTNGGKDKAPVDAVKLTISERAVSGEGTAHTKHERGGPHKGADEPWLRCWRLRPGKLGEAGSTPAEWIQPSQSRRLHDHERPCCKLCWCEGICERKRQRSQCKECGGAGICETKQIRKEQVRVVERASASEIWKGVHAGSAGICVQSWEGATHLDARRT